VIQWTKQFARRGGAGAQRREQRCEHGVWAAAVANVGAGQLC